MNKLKMWSANQTWEQNEARWDQAAAFAAQKEPIKGLVQLPKMPGITPGTAKNLKWKSLHWMVAKDEGWKIFRHFIKHPLRYGWAFLNSLVKKQAFLRDDDFFLYGIQTVQEFENLLSNPASLCVIGFSYCHKPLECPSKRFTDECIHYATHPVCQQCFIGKAMHALPEGQAVALIIPTIHYIGDKIFELVHAYPGRQIIFLITACEMTLKMFGDWGNMVNIKGIGVRLDGRICNTMKAFELSEQGVKPGLTVVLPGTQQRIMALIRHFREKNHQ